MLIRDYTPPPFLPHHNSNKQRRRSNLTPVRTSPSLGRKLMGQVFAALGDKIKGKTWREKQIRMITDKVFDTIKGETSVHKDHLTFDELYVAVLHVYNEINKRLSGPHFDPPTKEKLKAITQEFDVNLDGLLDREEFAQFIKKLTADTLVTVSRHLILAFIVAPTAALISKKATDKVLGIGKTVRKIPIFIYASIFAVVAVWMKNSGFPF